MKNEKNPTIDKSEWLCPGCGEDAVLYSGSEGKWFCSSCGKDLMSLVNCLMSVPCPPFDVVDPCRE